MKKWITIILVAAVIVTGTASVLLYKSARSPVEAEFDQASKRVLDETSINKIEKVSIYHGAKSYTVITGMDDQNEKVVAFVPEKKEEIIVKKWADGISKEQAINKLNDEKQPEEILSVRLGHESVGPVWEITYLDKQKNLNYFYLLFSNGEWWKKIENL
ncbi:cell wall elongation regulator TseB-like domain-containing protein [Rossellomorea sp. NS-SX7]|uniref:cell wall elongation regulator TseB-like domain-containing protein n=1 Tax=Rossellomorea sp. NS-SX7 TaxID=3463856 RepID=UPI004059A527